MCGIPNDIVVSTASGREVVLFARVLHEVFGDLPWIDVEHSAHCAWDQIAVITGQEWDEVRDALHRAWSLH